MNVIHMTPDFNRQALKFLTYSAQITMELSFDFFVDQRLAIFGAEHDVCTDF